MAHFAELDENNIVKRVIVIDNSETISEAVKAQYPQLTKDVLKDVKGKKVKIHGNDVDWEDEAKGAAFCNKLLGGRWVQTSYNNSIRFHYAGIGYKYDPVLDAFISPQPYPSWKLDKYCDWQAPTKIPDDGKMYNWDEATLNWIEV